ncbi:tRNA (Cytosine-5-)-methyltransferase [Elysia marginata]|uniref:tRNA (Cytosine-5-)-methyltransferase n=1 Tax=Elysia marginata TaxID=1093978 RepID=A0AAV4F6F4_9GAST|nr:tRNA (Cytosine-5-)-methyltransferase [Elysia marginata]
MAAFTQRRLRVLELYSGIGGMHWSLRESGVGYEIVMAVDINTTANKIYSHNFPNVNLVSFGLEKLTLKKLESLDINTILMSPPCQPFTRVGKKGDCNDVRTQSFLHLLGLIKQMKKKPTYILVENVKGFDTSQTRDLLMECLTSCGYTYQEFLLTPLQFGIPNCRLRYYLVAKSCGSFRFRTRSQVLTEMPRVCNLSEAADECVDRKTSIPSVADGVSHSSSPDPVISHSSPALSTDDEGSHSHVSNINCNSQNNISLACQKDSHVSGPALKKAKRNPEQVLVGTEELDAYVKEFRDAGRIMRYCEEEEKFVTEGSKPLSKFMETLCEDDLDQYLLSDKELRFFVVMDIVFPALKKSICFTKRYGHYVEGAGSVVQMCTDIQLWITCPRSCPSFRFLCVESTLDFDTRQQCSVF